MLQVLLEKCKDSEECVVREIQSKMAEVGRLREMATRQQAAVDALPGALLHEVFGGFERD
jgi:hypothetical protein